MSNTPDLDAMVEEFLDSHPMTGWRGAGRATLRAAFAKVAAVSSLAELTDLTNYVEHERLDGRIAQLRREVGE